MTTVFYTYSQSGLIGTTTISLPSLTTTFTPPTTGYHGCQPSLFCAHYSEAIPLGATMNDWDRLNPSQNVPFETECWPPGFNKIYWPVTGWDDISTLAYPGNACISGWTTACTTTISAKNNIQYTQTWCCPSSYSCVPLLELRLCGSLLSTATPIWAELQSPIGDIQFTNFTISAAPSSLPYLVLRNALPLQGLPAAVTATVTAAARSTDYSVAPLESFSTTSSSSNSAVAPTSPAQTGTATAAVSGLSPGATAGIGVGTAIGILAVAALLTLFFLRRRRNRPSSPPAVFNQWKPELPATETVIANPQFSYHSNVTPSAHIPNPTRELQATGSFHELEGAARYGVLDSSQRGN